MVEPKLFQDGLKDKKVERGILMGIKRLKLFGILIILAVAGLLILTSCAASGASKDAAPEAAYDQVAPAEPGYGYPGAEGEAGSAVGVSRGSSVELRENTVGTSKARHVIRNGSLELTVTDTRETIKKVQQITGAAGGVISESQLYEFREGYFRADLTLRIPVNHFDAVLEQLQELGTNAHIHYGEEDVTMHYLDMEARLENLKAQEERLREILAMATTVEEILQVESELGRVRGDIESLTVQFNYLKDQVSFSTIRLHISEEVITTQKISQAPFANLGGRIKEAFVRSINFISSAIAGLIVVLSALLPVLVVLAVIAFVIWFIVNRVNRRKPPAA